MILPLLRSATASLHERAERAVDLPARLQSVQAYTHLLERYYGIYRPLERRITDAVGATPIGLDLGPRLKAPLVRADLVALGRTDEYVEGIPLSDTLPDPAGPDEAFGCLYVLEGATLGGQIVRPRIEREHGLVAGRGGSFFSGYGDQTGRMWKTFCAALEDYAGRHPGAEQPIVGAARATFSCFEAWLAH